MYGPGESDQRMPSSAQPPVRLRLAFSGERDRHGGICPGMVLRVNEPGAACSFDAFCNKSHARLKDPYAAREVAMSWQPIRLPVAMTGTVPDLQEDISLDLAQACSP